MAGANGAPAATTRSSSAAATTASSPPPTSRKAGLRTLVLERRDTRRWRGRHDRARARARACRPWPTPSAGCGRRSSATSTSSATACRSSAPRRARLRAGARRHGDHAVGRRRRGPPTGLRAPVGARRRARTPTFDRLVRSLGRLPRRARRPDAARHRVARARRCARRAARSGARSAASAGTTAGPITARPADGRRRLRRRGVRDRRAPGRDRLARRPVHRDGPVVGGHDRGPARRLGRQRRRRGRARRSSPGAARARWPTALAAAARAAGVEIRTGAEVVAITSRDGRATGVVLAGGEEIDGTRRRRRHRPEADADRAGRPGRGRADRCCWRAGNIRTPGTVAKVNLVLSGLPTFPAARGDDERLLRGRIVVAPGIDAMERAFDAAKYGRPPERARSWRRRSRRSPIRRWSRAPRRARTS